MQLALWICSFQNGNALKKFIEFSSFHHLIGLLLLRRVKWETERSLNKLKWYFRPTFKYEFDSEIDPERLNYVYIYTGLIVAVLYLVFQRAMALFCFCLKASRRIHEKLFNGVTRAKMYFFNTNSSGRIINRFSKDINDIDYYLPSVLYDSILVSEKRITNESILLNSQLMESTPKKIPKYRKKTHWSYTFLFALQFLLQTVTSLILVLVANYWLLIPTLTMSLIFYGMRHIYVKTARCLKRLESMGNARTNERLDEVKIV